MIETAKLPSRGRADQIVLDPLDAENLGTLRRLRDSPPPRRRA